MIGTCRAAGLAVTLSALAGHAQAQEFQYPLIKGHGGIVALPQAAEQPSKESKVVLDITSDEMSGGVIKGFDRAALITNQYTQAGVGPQEGMKIAVILHDGHGLSGWWAQMVTVGYEQARGLRVPGQKADGFSANASRTIAAPVERAFTMIANSTGRRQWIGVPESTFEVTKATPTKSVRIAWKGDTRVEINLYAKGANKCMVQVQHNKLPDAEQAERAKKFWGAALDMLRGKLEL